MNGGRWQYYGAGGWGSPGVLAPKKYEYLTNAWYWNKRDQMHGNWSRNGKAGGGRVAQFGVLKP